MKIAVHKITKYVYEHQMYTQYPLEYNEFTVEIGNETIQGLYLDTFPKYKYENEMVSEINFKDSDEYKQGRRDTVDVETYYLVKKWCKEQAKCEEYYLRQAKTSTDFITYNNKCIDIIASQHTKKVDEGII